MDRRNSIMLLGLAGLAALAFVWQGQQANWTKGGSSQATASHADATATQVTANDWTTSEVQNGKWIGLTQKHLLDEGDKYADFDKSQIRLVNFQDFRTSPSSCSPSAVPCGSGGATHRMGSRVRQLGNIGNINADCAAAAGIWSNYCEPGLPGMPAPRRSRSCGLTCLSCGSAGCGSGCNSGCGGGCGIQSQGLLLPGLSANMQGSCGGGCGPIDMCAQDCGSMAAGGCALTSGCSQVSNNTVSGMLTHSGCGPDCGRRRQITGVDSATCVKSGEPGWDMRGPIPWEMFAQGEYVGPHRLRHQDKYRLRVDDELTLVYRVTRNVTPHAYQLNVGDEIRVESVADPDLDRELVIQPDGTITARLIGQVMAAGRTTDELRRDLEQRYTKFYNEPAMTVTPRKVNTKLEDLRATVDSRAGNGGQTFNVKVVPDGTVQLPGLGSVPAHGMTLEELSMEVNARYTQLVPGIEVTAVLEQRAPRFIYIVGEVARPGRVELVEPTTVIKALALAEGWVNGANLRNIVIFRRAEDWRLLATKVDIRGALYGTRPSPSDEIWLRDSDIVIVPKAPIKVLNDAIELIFTNGLYAAAPFFADPVIFTDASNL